MYSDLTDTKGLEPDDYNDWLRILKEEIEEKEKNNLEEQYHAILYCINASSDRIENLELKMISELRKMFPIGVVLTHCIKGKKKESIEGIKNELQNNGIDDDFIFEVCNVNETLLSGEIIEQFGKERILEYINGSLFSKITKRIPIALGTIIDVTITDYRLRSNKIIEKKVNLLTGHSNNNYMKIEDQINGLLIECKDKIDNSFEKEINDVFQAYQIIYDTFFVVDPQNKIINYARPLWNLFFPFR